MGFSRVVDAVIILLLCYYLWSCIFIERHYCFAPLSADSEDSLLRMTYDYAKQWNPVFFQRPEWMRLATCFSAFGLGAGYLLLLITFVFKLEALRGVCLLVVGAKIYAVATYFWVCFTPGSQYEVPSAAMLLAADAPYAVGIVLVLSRLLFNSHPFSSGRRPHSD